MLVLTRRTRQSIMIGDEIELTVLSVSGEKVRLGIEAPNEVPVFRKEVYLRIQGEGAQGEGASSNGTGELEAVSSGRG
jgi:carbon storage regulator